MKERGIQGSEEEREREKERERERERKIDSVCITPWYRLKIKIFAHSYRFKIKSLFVRVYYALKSLFVRPTVVQIYTCAHMYATVGRTVGHPEGWCGGFEGGECSKDGDDGFPNEQMAS